MNLALSILLLLVAAVITAVSSLRRGAGPFTRTPLSTWRTGDQVAFVVALLLAMAGFGGLLDHVQILLYGQTAEAAPAWGSRVVSMAVAATLLLLLQLAVFALLRRVIVVRR